MSGYISEFQYIGESTEEFIEIALPTGTDPTGWQVVVYENNGAILGSFSIGSSVGTMGGSDVYTVNDSTSGFLAAGGGAMGTLYPDDGIALVDGGGSVVQFLSYDGFTVSPSTGPAAGMTSTSVGTASYNESLQSDDGGATYFTQTNTNENTIPACFGPGSLIDTPKGPMAVEQLQPDDLITTVAGGVVPIRWIRKGTQPLGGVAADRKPVLIRADAFGPGLPFQDLVVSGQHRIVIGDLVRGTDAVPPLALAPSKALTVLPRIRFMAGKRRILWHHILCDRHELIRANGLATETLLLGPEALASMTGTERSTISRAFAGLSPAAAGHKTPALPCLSVAAARRRLARALEPSL